MDAVASDFLKEAVYQNSLFSRKGLSERLFSLWFNGFVYNQIWEDPRVDREALQLQADSRILTISSAGCNLLNYLVDSPAAVNAVDLNPYHVYFTRLKLAAIQHLPTYEDFFNFFGRADAAVNLENYHKYIQKHLDPETREFWEGGSWLRQLFKQQRIHYFTKNIYRYARFGYFLRFINIISKRAGCQPEKLLHAKTLTEQKQAYEQHVAPFFNHWLVRLISKRSFAVFSLGIPPQQHDALKAESSGDMSRLYHDRMQHLCCDFPIQDNYFAWQGLTSRYDVENRQAVPDYLKPEHYEMIKANLARVSLQNISLFDYLQQLPDNSLDRFIFLDAQDWMTDDTLTRLWQEVARVGRAGTRIIFRTAGRESPIETALPAALRQQFVYEKLQSEQLYQQDRSAIYGGFHLYVMPNK